MPPAGDHDPGPTVPLTPHPHQPPPPQTPIRTPPPGSHGSWGTIGPDGRLEPGQIVFGRYVVNGEIGRGGMGRVWLVRHLTLDADRALKTIVANIAFNSDARGRFAREARAMARFNHPNAVTVHDALLTDDVAFIEMEYVRGKSLDKVLKRGQPMPLDWIDRILHQLCDVLQLAHDSGIVHRDLKPSNLMLVDGRAEGREFLKVLDFGIAKILGTGEVAGDAHTLTNAVMGTPPYMSPEQAEGRSPQPLPDGRADGRTDLYAVGVILYEMLTGELPFRGSTAQKIAHTLFAPPPPLHEANPEAGVPLAIEQVVLRCLSKKPEARPQTAHDLYEAFVAALPKPSGELTVTGTPATGIEPPPPTTRIAARLALGGGWARDRPGPGPRPLARSVGRCLRDRRHELDPRRTRGGG